MLKRFVCLYNNVYQHNSITLSNRHIRKAFTNSKGKKAWKSLKLLDIKEEKQPNNQVLFIQMYVHQTLRWAIAELITAQ